MFDKKEEQLIDFYYQRLCSNCFDEKDVYSFFILVRRFAQNDWIMEIGDLIAHRERDRGIVYDSVEAAKKIAKHHQGKVPGSKGVRADEFIDMFNNLLKKINRASLCDNTITDILLCIYSLAQFSEYKEKGVVLGRVNIFISSKEIALVTADTGNDLHVVLSTIENKYTTTTANGCKGMDFCIDNPLTVFRKKGQLFIEYNNATL